MKTIDHPNAEVRQVSQKVIFEIYQKQGFDKIKDWVAKMPVKVLTSLVKVIPEVEPYIKLNQDQIKAANKTNAYGGGAKFSWAPNLLATS